MDAIAVITYPGHFMSTLGTIKNFLEVTHWRSPVYIFVDDLGLQWESWPNYIDDLTDAVNSNFPELNTTYIKFSEFGFPHVWDGWLRQQLVKLNLDMILPGNLWYVTDGDVILNRIPNANEIPFNLIPTRKILNNTQRDSYIRHMLGDVEFLKFNGERVYTHHVPCRWVTKNDLQDLRRYVSDRFKNDFNLVHYHLMREERITGYGSTPEHLSMTEWDLLETWRISIDQQMPEFRHWLISKEKSADSSTLTTFNTFFGVDCDLDLDHFKNQGILVNSVHWDKCQAIKRT